ncbi:MAG: DUF364 domain-containing protein [Termitinemataceae bacterium]|nr:MAG: DUF364 domain-containing protein [Termitinemataceae bacterium]
MWKIYDELIDPIPSTLKVDEAVIGKYWTFVRSGGRVGLAMSMGEISRPRYLPQDLQGMSLKELSASAKSWNFEEAALGIAAINAFWNGEGSKTAEASLNLGEKDSFKHWAGSVVGKKVAVIGHFPHLEKVLSGADELYILEKRPVKDDYPDSACEYLLPNMDFVFATGVTLINKTLPRLLELSAHCGIILAGPSVPLAPCLLKRGVIDLQGFVVTDPQKCVLGVKGETHSLIFDTGNRVSLRQSML